jgi:hypothetical protein
MEKCEELVSQCNFPWLLSNLDMDETKEPAGNAAKTKIVEFNGLKVFIIEYYIFKTLIFLSIFHIDRSHGLS